VHAPEAAPCRRSRQSDAAKDPTRRAPTRRSASRREVDSANVFENRSNCGSMTTSSTPRMPRPRQRVQVYTILLPFHQRFMVRIQRRPTGNCGTQPWCGAEIGRAAIYGSAPLAGSNRVQSCLQQPRPSHAATRGPPCRRLRNPANRPRPHAGGAVGSGGGEVCGEVGRGAGRILTARNGASPTHARHRRPHRIHGDTGA